MNAAAAAKLHQQARRNFEAQVAGNAYPGRGLVMGRAADGAFVQLYWLTGRSAGSRNRVLQAEGGRVRTAPRDQSAGVGDASLTLYDAMLEDGGRYIVGNGDQTSTLAAALARGESLEAGLSVRAHEPDAPNFTPRITGLLDFRAPTAAGPELTFSILKAQPADPRYTQRFAFRFPPPPAGLGLGFSTYSGDGKPLPAFAGEPLWLPLAGTAEEILAQYWRALPAEKRVALALKRIPQSGTGESAVLLNNH